MTTAGSRGHGLESINVGFALIHCENCCQHPPVCAMLETHPYPAATWEPMVTRYPTSASHIKDVQKG